jgi:hypothetical protein
MLSLLLLLGISVGLRPPKNKSKNNRHTLSISPHLLRRINRASKYALTNNLRRSNAISMHLQARQSRGAPPTPEMMEGMGKLIEQSFQEGFLLSTEGCLPSCPRRARPLHRRQLRPHRRPLHRVQRDRRRLRPHPGQIQRRGHRIHQALPKSNRRRRDRDPPAPRTARKIAEPALAAE